MNKIDYTNLTPSLIEEYADVINWLRVPTKVVERNTRLMELYQPDKESFYTRKHIEKFLLKLRIKSGEDTLSENLYFFHRNKFCMIYVIQHKTFWFSRESILNFDLQDFKTVLENLVKFHYDDESSVQYYCKKRDWVKFIKIISAGKFGRFVFESHQFNVSEIEKKFKNKPWIK